MEHQVAQILTQQEINGWQFNEKESYELESTLRRELEHLTQVLRRQWPYVGGTLFTPKRNNRTLGYYEGCESIRIKELNPTSRDHIAWILQTHYGWTPSSISSNGKPVIDEIVLKDIGTDIALRFLRCLDLKKQLGMISEGVNAWQKLCTKSRIHHHCSVATITHRCAHRRPNLGQVNAEERFRKLFTASPSMFMVGADLSGIELRMLAHYLARYDKGRYADILLNGDIHQTNADKIGVSRRQVKTISYAMIYGAGNQKLGASFDASLSKKAAERKGKEIREAFVNAIPGLSDLLEGVKRAAERGWVRSLDGRHINVDKGHQSLNYLLQSGAAVIAKRWMVLAHENLPKSARQLAFIHDELQFEAEEKDVEDLKFLLELSATQAGEYYNLRIPIAAESKAGMTWADVH
tara:strand:+ start:1464 stop:2687 length:1224 start_codon:yes stop_codon:yes gene_type:complete